MNKAILSLGLLFGLATFGVVVHNANANCVEVYVDFGPLSDGSKTSQCITSEGSVSAYDILNKAGYVLDGTVEYGDAVVCRVNGFPDATIETCESMPPAEAYWAVLVKEHQVVPMPLGIAGAWGWAQTGANEIYLEPGDSIGLVFADNGEVRFP